jgi:hypothetical protein
MKKSIYMVLAACFVLTGCERGENNREVLSKLDAISSDLKKGVVPVRWATANKSQISTAIYVWSREKMEQDKKAEALPPETEAKISEYEALKMELIRMPMGRHLPTRTLRFPPPVTVPQPSDSARPEASAADKEYEALSNRVAEAKAPIAAIVDRRERQAADYYRQYSVEGLIAEYVKGHYDLIVDSQERVLYRTPGEITDITEGVMALFKEKTKQ